MRCGQEHLTRETSAQAPEDFLADVRLEPIESEDDTALRLGQAPQDGRGEGQQGDPGATALGRVVGKCGGPCRALEHTERRRVAEPVWYMEAKAMKTLLTLIVDITIGLGLMALGLGVFVLGPTFSPGGGVLQPARRPVMLVESDVREGVGGIIP